jgi:glycerol-3-phosphate O-acyltransferase
MTGTVALPFWVFVILAVTFVLAVIRVVIFPLWASFWSVRSRHVVEEINPLLQLHLSPFTLTRRQVLADRLASDETIEAAVEDISRQRGQSPEKLRRECWRIAWDIVPNFNPYFYFRIGYRLARSALRSLYRVRVTFADEQSMAGVSDQAAVLFIINHRSNIDYVVANFLTAKRTMLSFGVGEWSRMWPIQPLMRMAGGYFVRRDSGDPLYRLLLKRYVQMATAARVPHAIFLEGRLSPDGSVGEPRLGLLSYVTENFDPESSVDLVFIPVGINYDRIVEDTNMVRFTSEEFRRMGRPYVARNLLRFTARLPWELIRRQRAYGYTCAAFGKPVTFSSWLTKQDVTWPQLNREQRFQHIRDLGRQLIEDITELVPATPVPILCCAWREDLEQEYTEEQLQQVFHHTVALLQQSGCHLVLANGNEADTLDHALSLVLKRKMIVRTEDKHYGVGPDAGALVSYYANSIHQHLTGC